MLPPTGCGWAGGERGRAHEARGQGARGEARRRAGGDRSVRREARVGEWAAQGERGRGEGNAAVVRRRRSPPPLICAYATHLLRVRHEHVARVGRDLVRQEHGDIELGRDLDELADVLAELLLALGELAAAAELDAEEAHDGVDDEQLDGLLGVRDLGRHGRQHLVLLLVVLAARDEHVVEHLVAVQAEALDGDLGHALGAEGLP